MKKFTDPRPIPNGGLPLYGGDFVECLQTEVYRAIAAMYKSYGQPIVVNGCAVVADTGAGTCTITAGMAFIDGDLIDVPSYAGAYPVYLKQGAPVEILKNYKDQQPRVVMINKATEWTLAIPGAGEYITFDPYTSQRLNDVQRRALAPSGQCEWFPTIPNEAAFDVNGLGKWEWLGYAFANGNHSTANLTGRVPAQFNAADADMAIGNPYGAKTHSLTADENGPHSHAYNIRIRGAVYPNQTDNADGTANQVQTTTSSGLGSAHNNMQPTLFGVWIQRR